MRATIFYFSDVKSQQTINATYSWKGLPMRLLFLVVVSTILFVSTLNAQTLIELQQDETPSTAVAHNTWTSGAAMPTALHCPATGVISGRVYLVGGATNSAVVNVSQIYNPKTNKWAKGVSMPTPRFCPASAVVNNILYVIGGNSGTTQLNVVEAYDPTTETWSSVTPMPTARDSITAAVKDGIIYVIGGYNGSSGRLNTVESYNPATDLWTEEAPLLVAKSLTATGLLGSVIVAAGGLTDSGVISDNEAYNSSSNSWKDITSDPTAREGGCFSIISGQLYLAGGTNFGASGPMKVTESFSAKTNSWTPLASMPLARVNQGSAQVNNLLYCFGGSNNGNLFQGTVYNNLQIYQP
jgi:N-acetylneuraminic acid mutarotase